MKKGDQTYSKDHAIIRYTKEPSLDATADPDLAGRKGPDTQTGGVLKILWLRAFARLFQDFEKSNSR